MRQPAQARPRHQLTVGVPPDATRGARIADSWGDAANRGTTGAAVLFAFAAYLAFIAHGAFRWRGESYFTLADDAMVSMRYAYNLAHGHGLIWNPGAPAVEGYTNFLWTAWMAAVHLLPLPVGKVPLVISLSGVGLIVGTAFATRRVVELVAPDRPRAATLGLLLTLCAYPLVFWTLRGMEVGLLALVTTAGTALTLALRRDEGNRLATLLAVTLAVGILTRTDFLPSAAVLAGFAVAFSPRQRRRGRAAGLFGTILFTAAAHTAVRLAVYGSAVPNTYTLKMSGVATSARLERGMVVAAVTLGGFLVVPIVLAAAHLWRERRLAPESALVVALVGTQLLYTGYVGGDVWEWLGFADRFVTPVLPVLLALAALGCDDLLTPRRRSGATVALRRAAIVGVGLGLIAALTPLHLVPGTFSLKVALVTSLTGCLTLAVACHIALTGRVAEGTAPPRFVPALALTVALAALAGSALPQLLSSSDQIRWDIARARWGLEVGDATEPEAVIAVASAGNIVYFADRTAVDMLGKSDPVIANGAPLPEPFLPGHNKWDYDYSIGQLAPDLVADPVRVTRDYDQVLDHLDYTEVLSPVYARRDTTKVDRESLQRVLTHWEGACPWQGVAPCRRAPSRTAS